MKKKWICPTCLQIFSRHWNLQRHSEDIHGVSLFATEQKVKENNRRKFSSKVQNVASSSGQSNFDKTVDQTWDLIRNFTENAKSMNLATNLQTLKRQLMISQNELAWIKSNNWIISKREIRGISGYLCRRCNTLSFIPIKDPGFDMTMQAKHICDEEKIKRIFCVSIRPIDVWNRANTMAVILFDRLNFIIPGDKYLYAQDFSSIFYLITDKLGFEIAYETLGIPNRFPLHSLQENHNIDWVDGALNNLGKKVLIDEEEIRDFLRRINSTYAIFEIASAEKRRWIFMTLTA